MFIDSFEWRELPGCGCTPDGIEHVAMVRDLQAEPLHARLDRRVRQAEAARPRRGPVPVHAGGVVAPQQLEVRAA